MLCNFPRAQAKQQQQSRMERSRYLKGTLHRLRILGPVRVVGRELMREGRQSHFHVTSMWPLRLRMRALQGTKWHLEARVRPGRMRARRLCGRQSGKG